MLGVERDTVVDPAAVHPRELLERTRDGGDHQVGVRDLHAVRLLDHRNQPFARRVEGRGVDVASDEEMRDRRPALRRALGHDAADRADGIRRARGHWWRRSSRTSRGSCGACAESCRQPARRNWRRSARGLRGLQDVVREDLASRSGPSELGDVDAVLAREPSRLRRNLRARNRRRLGSGGRGCRSGGRRRRLHLPSGLRLGAAGRNRLTWLEQPGDRLPDWNDVADLRGHARQHAVAGRFDLDDRLVGLDLEQHLAFLDLLAFLLLPRNQLARFLRHLERRHHHAHCH